jgi:hypothetical protein
MKTGVGIAVALVAGVIGLATGLTMGKDGDAAVSSGTSKARAESARLEDEITRLNRKLTEQRREDATGEQKVAPSPRPDSPAKHTDRTGVEGDDEKEEQAWFFGDSYASLNKVNWPDVGSSLSAMNPLIRKVARDLMAGRRPDGADIGRISKLTTHLVAAAFAVKDELPGRPPSGSFSAPAFMVNAMTATLAAAKKPLSATQLESLERTARTFMREDRRRRDAYVDGVWEISKVYEEAALKDRFFIKALSILTAEQADVLKSRESHGRLRLSLFSSATMLETWARPFTFVDRSELLDQMLREVDHSFALSEDQRPKVRQILEEWADGLPSDLTEEPGNVLDLKGMVTTDRVIRWGKLTHDLMKTLAAELEFREVQLAQARRSPAIPVGVLRPKEAK